MEDYLTTHQVQEILKVDRITIYRMLQDGRIKGVKIGQQWRFSASEVERLVNPSTLDPTTPPNRIESIFPIHCVQTIQDLFSSISQISALVLDHNGQPVTNISQPCCFYEAASASPAGKQAYLSSWKRFCGEAKRGETLFTCHAGMNYVGSPLFARDMFIGLFLAGPFYWHPADPDEEKRRLQRLAENSALPVDHLQDCARQIPCIEENRHAQVQTWPASAARAIHSILKERTDFVQRLQQIANLSQID